MLRKRSRPSQKEQSRGQMMPESASDTCFSSDGIAQKPKNSSFFSVPGLLVGFTTKCLSDSDSARSPTSPLDYKLLSNLSSSFVRSPRSPSLDGQPKCWDCCKVGLGLVDSLNDEIKPCGMVLRSSESRSILLGSQMRINIPSPKYHLDSPRVDDPFGTNPNSLPIGYGTSSQARIGLPLCRQPDCSEVVMGSFQTELGPGEFGKIRSCSVDNGGSSMLLGRLMYQKPKSGSEVFPLDSNNAQLNSPPVTTDGMNVAKYPGSVPIPVSPSQRLMTSLSASEIEESEDYTCIISHGPNPRTTHIFGDCILESHSIESPRYKNKRGEEPRASSWVVKCSDELPTRTTDDFLSFCFYCKKKLEEGKDIYMYRGEKAFCSCNCREQEILMEEETEKPATGSSDSLGSSFHEELFLTGMVVET